MEAPGFASWEPTRVCACNKFNISLTPSVPVVTVIVLPAPKPISTCLFSRDLRLSSLRSQGRWTEKASRRGTETAWEVGVSWFEKRKRCVQTMDPHLTGLLCGWIKINTHTHLIIIPSMPCVPDQAAHPISSAEETLASADRRPRGRLRLHLSRWQPSRSSAQTGLSLGQTRQQSLPFLWDWSGIERAVRKITPRREWWGWGPLGGGEKMMRDQSKVRKSISFSLQIYKFRGL